MIKTLGFILLLLAVSFSESSIVHPISESHRSAALELFSSPDGSFNSLEEAYEALRTFEVLGIEKSDGISSLTCQSVVDTLGSSSSSLKDVFYALKVQRVLKCEPAWENLKDVSSRLQSTISSASSLLDLYYSVGSLVLIKDQTTDFEVTLEDASGIFRSIKSLSQSDGRWRYNSNYPESSTHAAGIAFETLAGVVTLAPSEIDQSLDCRFWWLELFEQHDRF